MELSFRPLFNYIDIKPFKFNEIYVINSLLKNNVKINSIYTNIYYGNVNFKSNKHDIWDIELFEEYQKTKTNSIILELLEDDFLNPRKYKYLVIFQNLTNLINSFGYAWVTNKDIDKEEYTNVSIDYEYDTLIKCIIRDINTWPTHKLYNAINNIPRKFNEIEINDIYKEYINIYRALAYEDWENELRKYNAKYKI